ncbi:MAG: hypothetical protein JW919_04920 [Candidatus Omnitrophica bacterium]|nr:hypothetical protein [Candidatus Omnitrophota bacterium]
MRTLRRKGFVIILAVTLMSVLIIMAWAIINFGCGEILSTRSRNDLVISAYYVAIGGAEYMYAKLRTITAMDWNSPPTASGTITVDSNTIGSYSVEVKKVSSDVLAIISDGTVNNRTATAVVRYGYDGEESLRPVPIGARGDITIDGASSAANVKMEGPVMSGGTITETDNVKVQNEEDNQENYEAFQPDSPVVDFWKTTEEGSTGNKFDTNDDTKYPTTTENADYATATDYINNGWTQQDFDNDDVYPSGGDDKVDVKDAFFYYYTTYLNNEENLGINPGGSNYYTGNQTFEQGDIANDVKVIFVDGDVAVTYNDQDWEGDDELKHTIVAMGKLKIEQPTNRPDDTLVLVSCNKDDVHPTDADDRDPDHYALATYGTMGDRGGVIGDVVFYTRGDFLMLGGGKLNLSAFAEGTVTIDTVGDDQGADHRILNAMTVDWTSEEDKPIGVPPGYPIRSFKFTIKSESQYRPIWQRS